MKLGLVFALVLVQLGLSIACQCDYVANEGILSCDRNVITNFPEDFFASCPNLVPDTNAVTAVDLHGQPMKIIQKDAFKDFPNLIQVALSYNTIDTIEEGSFDGLDFVTSLYLRNNNITQLPDGVLDSMVSLDSLDIRGNPLQNYTTKSWTFCHGIQFDDHIVNDVEVLQDYQSDRDLEDKYCLNWAEEHLPNFDDCKREGDVLDCTGIDPDTDLQGLGCHLMATDEYSKVLVNFPKEPKVCPSPKSLFKSNTFIGISKMNIV